MLGIHGTNVSCVLERVDSEHKTLIRHRTQDSGPGTQDPGLGIQNTGPGTHDTGHREVLSSIPGV